MSENGMAEFENAYRANGVEACRKLHQLQQSGLHDIRLKLREKEITHEAIVELDDRLKIIEAAIRTLQQQNPGK